MRAAAPPRPTPRATRRHDASQRLLEASLRLQTLQRAAALAEAVVDEVLRLSPARRVLLLDDAVPPRRILAARLPVAEDTPYGRAALLQAIESWLDEARRSGKARLRHGPDGAVRAEQRSCLVLPLRAGRQRLGFVYADVEGAFARLDDADRRVLALLGRQVALALRHAARVQALEAEAERHAAELRDAREQQHASAEVLRAIGQAGGATQPVFELILGACQRLFEGLLVGLNLVGDDGQVYLGAYHGPQEAAMRAVFPLPLSEASGSGRCILGRRALQFADVERDAWLPEGTRRSAAAIGFRSVLFAPMIAAGRGIGALWVARQEPGRFDERQVALLQGFADQALIAIRSARLLDDTQQALQRQTATSGILRVISSSPTDVQPVFEAIAERARALCGAMVAGVTRFDGEWVHLAAFHGVSAEAGEAMRSAFPMRPGAGSITARAVRDRAPVQIADVTLDADYGPKDVAQRAGYRSGQAVPMLKDGKVIGAVAVFRAETGPFPERQVQLLQTFADQAVIAIENVRLFNETKEALQRQTATSEILRVISESPSDVQPVLDAVAERAAHICEAEFADVVLRHGDAVRVAASVGDLGRPVGLDIPLDRDTVMGRSIIDARPVQVADLQAAGDEYPAGSRLARQYGHRTILAVPMLREGRALGTILLRRTEVRPFEHKHIDLLATFASQAALALEQVRMHDDTRRALERQTATAEVLHTLGSSVTDATPVFERIVASCRRLFEIDEVGIAVIGDDDQVQLAVHSSNRPGLTEAVALYYPVPRRQSMQGLAIHRAEVLHYPDTLQGEHVPWGLRELAERHGNYSAAVAPMTWQGRGIGGIHITRRPPTGFSESELAMLKVFADQAAIAIQNARMVSEMQQALDRQTAVAEVLRVVAASPNDTQPMFEALARNANRVLGGFSTVAARIADGQLQLVGFTSTNPEGDTALQELFPSPLAQFPMAAQIRSGVPYLVGDTETQADVPEQLRTLARMRGYRRLLMCPMLREGAPVGMLSVTWREAGTIPPAHVELLRSFADQAVIAIENVRLFNETKEALDQQRASGEILSVISQSVSDTAPVFDKILHSCKHLFGSDETAVLLVGEQQQVHLGAYLGVYRDAVAATFPAPLAKSPAGLAIGRRRVVHLPDIQHNPEVTRAVRRVAAQAGYSAMAYAPMLWKDQGIGAIGVSRRDGGFADKELALLQTFADQAAIAIQNARLFNETRQALERQTATSDILRVISESPTDVQPVLDAVAERAGLLCRSEGSRVWLRRDGQLRAMTRYGPAYPAGAPAETLPLRRDSVAGRAVLERRVVHVEDVLPLIDTDYPRIRELQARYGFRTVLCVPLLREGEAVGVIALLRNEVRPFAAAEIGLLQTFADQAVVGSPGTELEFAL